MRPMTRYVLKLYEPQHRPLTARVMRGEYAFQAANDAAAIAHAEAEYAEGIADSDNAVLFDPGSKPIWFKVPWDA